jgi:ADP-heptose:LPS heptosyltransferase
MHDRTMAHDRTLNMSTSTLSAHGWRMNQSELLKAYVVPVLFPALAALDGVVIRLGRIFRRKGAAKDVIFVRTDNLGDFVLWIPIASALRKHWPWPGFRFMLIANASWAELAQSTGLFDEVLAVHRKKLQRRLGYRFRTLFGFARLQAELVVNPINSRDPLSSDSVARAIFSKRKIAARGDTSEALGQEKLANRWYDELVDPSDPSAHESLRNRDFLARFAGTEITDPWPVLTVLQQGMQPVEISRGPYAVIAPGAEAPRKVWPPERFARMADKLVSESGLQVVLVGTPSELPQIKEVQDRCTLPVLNLAGKLTILDLLPVLRDAKLILTNDTGTAHLGAAFRVATVCIAGGGQFKRFVPYPDEAKQAGIRFYTVYEDMPCFGCNWRCIYSVQRGQPMPCVSTIGEDATWSAVEAALNEGPRAL